MAYHEQKVLVVDDAPSTRDSFLALLASEQIEGRGSGTIAEALAVQRDEQPAVAVVDFLLPDGTGVELATLLKSLDPTIRVLLATGNASIESAISAVGLLDHYLVKPIPPSNFLQAVRNALDRHRVEAEVRRLEAQARASADFAAEFAKSPLEPSEVIETIVKGASTAFGNAAGVFLVAEDGRSLKLASLHHDDPDARRDIINMFDDELHPAFTGLLGQVVTSQTTLVLPDVPLEPLRGTDGESMHQEFYDHFPIRSLIVSPLIANGELLGVFTLIRTLTSEPYDQSDVPFVEDLAERAALALHSANMFAQSERSSAVLRGVFRTAGDGIILIDSDGVIVMVNEATSLLFGYANDELVGQNVSMLMFDQDRTAHDGYLEHYLETGETNIIGVGRDVEGRRKDGESVFLHLAVSEVDAGSRMFTGILHDITNRRMNERLLREAATTDSLTGLVNRSSFRQHLTRVIVTEAQLPFAVLFIDLDDFKIINDTFGHDVGDSVLIAVARRLAGSTRESDIVARWGGDEFTMLSPLDATGTAKPLVDRIKLAFDQPFSIARQEFRLGVSIGIASWPYDGKHADDIVRIADSRMYKAKRRMTPAVPLADRSHESEVFEVETGEVPR